MKLGVSNELREAVKLLEEEVVKLGQWADVSLSGGWSTHQVKPMRDRAEFLRNRVNALKVQVYGL